MGSLLGPLLTAPLIVTIVLFFVLPTIFLFTFSFWIGKAFLITPAFTFENYVQALTTPTFYSVTMTGLRIGLVVGVMTVSVSFPVAYFIVFRAKTDAILYAALLTWFSSYLVRIYAWRTILGANGLINSALIYLGLIREPISFFIFSPFAVIITLVHIFLPFSLLLIVSALREVKPEYIEAARDLGAGIGSVFSRVIIPLSIRGLIGAFMFTFVLAAGDYVTPRLVGGREGITTGLLIADYFKVTGNWPLGAAMAFILLGLFLFIYFLVVQAARVSGLAPARHRVGRGRRLMRGGILSETEA
jgi:spermidine/putrescine transport system permease protein